MSNIHRLVNWTNLVSIHQVAWMRALSSVGWDVTCVVAEHVSQARSAMGWNTPNSHGINVVVNPSHNDVRDILDLNQQHSLHLFGGMFNYSWGKYAFYRSAQLKRRMAIISESSDIDGWKAPLRLIKHKTIRLLFEKKIQFVLAMGQLGVNWFRRCGYPAEKLFPFGYFVERQVDSNLSNLVNDNNQRKFTILFVGSLIQRKRVDLILNAMATLPHNTANLMIVGDGSERARLQSLSEKLGLTQSTTWFGYLPWQEARHLMLQADLLILPSRMDGWGAVINEALMSGTPVICSDHCGAADLLLDKWRGDIVPRNDVASLSEAIRRRLEKGPISEEQRFKIKQWSENISGEAAAAYLQSIIAYVYDATKTRPTPPWYNEMILKDLQQKGLGD